MEHIDKIKALQAKAGIEADGIVSSKTWLNIHYLLFGSLPYDINIDSIIKSIQKKIKVRIDGYPWHKTWDILYDLLIVKAEKSDVNKSIDLHNEEMLDNLPEEVVPFAKELITLAADHGITIRITNNTKNKFVPKDSNFTGNEGNYSIYNFGLAFDVKILEKSVADEPESDSPHYEKIAKLGESIGLTWTGNKKAYTTATDFVLRPAWAVRMKEVDMVKELCRRKKENINLLAIL
ncbi:M15 family metallopeptidase [Pedobacter polaris]|uniref:M15 family metallopeptidase n=1 Tax=Pedobacter polaris TaxID=2571273 RepID=A0A4V5NZF7_9SPHI|nr:M15 family metallopeptidase [Pedobacter polaris]TKC08375.1 M15 family metallopeptidase [Pedobacter polaris]